MAEIELGPLSDRLSDDEIAELARQMEKLGAGQMPHAEEGAAASVGDSLDDDVLSEFLDRLEASDAAADIYLPLEFDDVLEVAGLRIASAPVLVDVLEELKDDLDIDEERVLDEDDEDYDEDQELLDANLRQAWKVFYATAQASVERKLPLHVKS
jgi:hypothetical protein